MADFIAIRLHSIDPIVVNMHKVNVVIADRVKLKFVTRTHISDEPGCVRLSER